MMKQKKLVEAFVVADVSDGLSYWRNKTPEQEAKALESLCSEFNDFVRDHRSMDWVTLEVQRVYLDWEVDDEGVPMCCRAAIEEYTGNDNQKHEQICFESEGELQAFVDAFNKQKGTPFEIAMFVAGWRARDVEIESLHKQLAERDALVECAKILGYDNKNISNEGE